MFSSHEQVPTIPFDHSPSSVCPSVPPSGVRSNLVKNNRADFDESLQERSFDSFHSDAFKEFYSMQSLVTIATKKGSTSSFFSSQSNGPIHHIPILAPARLLFLLLPPSICGYDKLCLKLVK